DPLTSSDGNRLYIMIAQPGALLNDFGAGAYHLFVPFPPPLPTFTEFQYAVVGNDGNLDDVTGDISHEMVEAVTDLQGLSVQVNPRNAGNPTRRWRRSPSAPRAAATPRTCTRTT